MNDALIIDAVRTPIGRYAGVLSSVRADDLGAVPLRELLRRHPQVDWSSVDDVIYGCANQAGEDNRNVARMSALLAGLPVSVPGTTLNRLCGSGLDAVGTGLPGVMWAVVLVGAIIGLSATFFFKVEDARLHGILVTLLAAFMGLIIFMILALDQPFRGDLGISPQPYQLIYDHLMQP